MSTADLKLDLINKITNLTEAHIVVELQRILDFELDKGVFQLTDTQKNRLMEAKNDNVLTEEQANNEIKEWLKGK